MSDRARSVRRVSASRSVEAASRASDNMEAPARGMLRRPIGLLASTTTRAEADPETMGHTAVPSDGVVKLF